MIKSLSSNHGDLSRLNSVFQVQSLHWCDFFIIKNDSQSNPNSLTLHMKHSGFVMTLWVKGHEVSSDPPSFWFAGGTRCIADYQESTKI